MSLGPPRSPDLSACDFFLWGYLRSKEYTFENLVQSTIWKFPFAKRLQLCHNKLQLCHKKLQLCHKELQLCHKKLQLSQEIATVPQEIETVPQEIETVPQEIATVPQEIATVPQETLVNVMRNFEGRLRTRVRQEGRHLSDIIFRKWVISVGNQNSIYYRLFWCWHNFFVLKINKVTIIWKTRFLFAPHWILWIYWIYKFWILSSYIIRLMPEDGQYGRNM